jgi:hypothetical protein
LRSSPPRHGLIDDDVGAVAEQLVGPLEDRRDVRALQVRVEQLARLPALDEREPGGIVAALVQRVEDAAVLRVRGRDERLERLEALGLLAGLCLEGTHDDDFGHTMLLLRMRRLP